MVDRIFWNVMNIRNRLKAEHYNHNGTIKIFCKINYEIFMDDQRTNYFIKEIKQTMQGIIKKNTLSTSRMCH